MWQEAESKRQFLAIGQVKLIIVTMNIEIAVSSCKINVEIHEIQVNILRLMRFS